MTLSGPIFEPSKHGPWRSVHGASGGHYNVFACEDWAGMTALRELFPDGEADEMNFVLFSTSGVHGSYTTIEELETDDSDDDEYDPSLTFLVVQPRLCTLRYGECQPTTTDDFAFLKRLRESSHRAVAVIGLPTPEGE